jgi:hypothetical protein
MFRRYVPCSVARVTTTHHGAAAVRLPGLEMARRRSSTMRFRSRRFHTFGDSWSTRLHRLPAREKKGREREITEDACDKCGDRVRRSADTTGFVERAVRLALASAFQRDVRGALRDQGVPRGVGLS